MIQKFFPGLSVIIACIMLLLLCGCAVTAPSKFYTLNSLKIQDTARENSSESGIDTVAVGPVTIPDYLDRPQIVTHSSIYELNIDEFNRWAGSLCDDIMRVLTENLSVLLSRDHISVYPWQWGTTAKYRVKVDVMRFDAVPDGKVILAAHWSVIDDQGKRTLKTLETNISESIQGPDYSAKVSAMSKALEALSRDIADAIKNTAHGTTQ